MSRTRSTWRRNASGSQARWRPVFRASWPAQRARRSSTSSVDGVIVSQVIEHLPDDGLLASEVARILRPGGWWYIGSVLRAPRAWWVYKQDGRRLLDPTHVREYASREEFQAAIEHPELLLTDLVVSPFRFPLVDLVARGAAVLGLINHETLVRLYARHPALARLRRLTVRPPGYCPYRGGWVDTRFK